MSSLKNYIFTSESVSEGHPDKVCDQISDAILDAYLAQDPKSRVACETLVTTNLVVIAGEITSKGKVDTQEVARDVIRKIGYNDINMYFDADFAVVASHVHAQSP
ncbi:methionine adenosyltransferase, partial [Leptospira meyeri]